MLNEEIETRLAQERRARLAAERLLAQKQRELSAANAELSKHAFKLSDQIVEQRHEAEELKDENFQVRSDLQRAEKRLWTSVETIEDGFAVFDSARRMILANPAYLSAFDGLEEIKPGVGYSELLELATEEGIVDTEDLGRDEWCAMMQGRWSSDHIDPIVVRLWNGSSIKLIERRGEDGDIVTLALNITDTIRKEKALTEARHKAEAASRAKSAFLANMSHELRTPMNGVVGMAQLLSDGSLDEEQQLFVDTIRQSGESLLHIINEVLDYSKMEAEKLVLHPQPFNLEQLFHDVVLLSLPGAQEKGITIALDFDMFLPEVFVGDPGRLRQVLTNLIGNAVKFTAEGHVAIRVLGTGAGEHGQDIVVNVEDTGIGIAPDMCEHIFGEFNQAEDDRNRNYEGTGLGLAITRQLIELMGGEIWVDSEQGRGSCFSFRVTLPIGSEGADAFKSPQGLGFQHALLLEPEPLSSDVLSRQLSVFGMAVTHAETAERAAEELAKDAVIDLVVLDLAALSDGGRALIDQVRARDPSIPIIRVARTLSGHQEKDDCAAFDALLTQPVLRADLMRVLTELPRPAPMLLDQPVEATAPAPETNGDPAAAGPDAAETGLAEDIEIGPFMSARKRAAQAREGEAAPHPERHETQAPTEEDARPKLPENLAAVPPSGGAEGADTPALEDTRKMRVLAAEDNRTNQLVFRKMLRDLNIELQFAGNGEEAVAAYESFKPDLVFMDISMPKMDGMEATRQIRSIEARTGTHVPVTAMTAHAMDGDADRILAAGLDYYLTKPLKKDAIHAKIKAFWPETCAPLRLDTAAE